MENELVLSSLELFYEYKQGQYNGLDSRIAVNNIKALIDKITNKNTTSLISVWFVYIKRCQPTMVDMSHHLAFLKSQLHQCLWSGAISVGTPFLRTKLRILGEIFCFATKATDLQQLHLNDAA